MCVGEQDRQRQRQRERDNVRRREKWRERLKENPESDGVRGGGGRSGAIQVPQIFAQPNNLKQRPLKAQGAGRDSSLDGYGGSDGLEGR